jgi:hypothetical protein
LVNVATVVVGGWCGGLAMAGYQCRPATAPVRMTRPTVSGGTNTMAWPTRVGLVAAALAVRLRDSVHRAIYVEPEVHGGVVCGVQNKPRLGFAVVTVEVLSGEGWTSKSVVVTRGCNRRR